MSIVTKLKSESLRLRKEKNPLASSIQFALSEIEKIGKNNGNRITTEDEAIKAIQKIVATLENNMQIADVVTASRIQEEINILSSVLPRMVSDEEVRSYLLASFVETPVNKGVAMKALRTKFGALIDMKSAGEIVTELYGV